MRLIMIPRVLMIIYATQASAMVPPPPPPGIAPIIRSFVQAIQAKNLTAYMDALAENVRVTEGGEGTRI